jgi:hypothetical protein
VRQVIAVAIAINAIGMCALFGEPTLFEDGDAGKATPFVQNEIRNARGKPLQARRPGDRSLETVVRTDERYGHDGLFHGPRGKVYWDLLEHPRPIQNPNLWTDSQSTYFLADMTLPPGSSVTLHSSYPHSRYFQFALYKFKNNTYTSINEALEGREIEPDPGSSNPFSVGANRLVETRQFTLRIVAKDAPQGSGTRTKNTLYSGRDGGQVEALIRIYLPDKGYDGTGWMPADAPAGGSGMVTYEATLADGRGLSANEVIAQLARPIAATKPAMTADQWEELRNARDNDSALDHATAPARTPPRWEKMWTLRYSIAGAFKSAADRAKIPYVGAMEGGGDPTTQYFIIHLSRRFGPVYVMRGKMPTYPDTYAGSDGKVLAIVPETQTRYWSLVSCEAAPTGQVADGLTDFQVPLDAHRKYTIVVSRPEDRPRNATVENGVAWLDWGTRGEGLDGPRNRPDFGMLMMRIMANNPSWEQSPDRVTVPGTEQAVMGPYYPSGFYTTKEQFESDGGNPSTKSSRQSHSVRQIP